MTYSLCHEALAPQILTPQRLYPVAEITQPATPVPKASGVYAWWFDTLPALVPIDGAVKIGEFLLRYIGIAPSGPLSKRTLRDRLRNHSRGPIAVSTLRRGLAVLLQQDLSLHIFKLSNGKLALEQDGEKHLTSWMKDHARVCWAVVPKPWEFEHSLIAAAKPPLNVAGGVHPFAAELRRLRSSITKARSRRRVHKRYGASLA
jgi:hypothetical protein